MLITLLSTLLECCCLQLLLSRFNQYIMYNVNTFLRQQYYLYVYEILFITASSSIFLLPLLFFFSVSQFLYCWLLYSYCDSCFKSTYKLKYINSCDNCFVSAASVILTQSERVLQQLWFFVLLNLLSLNDLRLHQVLVHFIVYSLIYDLSQQYSQVLSFAFLYLCVAAQLEQR